jgi:UDPglucose 6-dehydrogenase
LHTNVRIYDKDVGKSTHTLVETINKSDFIFISVPTPMTGLRGGKIDLTIMDGVFEEISAIPKDDNFSYEDVTFIVKSTVIPGTIERYIDKYPHMRIAFSPEFLTERSAYLDFINTARIVIGANKESIANDIESLFRTRFPYTTIIKTDVGTAQFIKYMANCFFSVKLSFMNEMLQAAEAFDINWSDAQRGFITDGRIGNSHIDVPGHDGSRGFGGKCVTGDTLIKTSLGDISFSTLYELFTTNCLLPSVTVDSANFDCSIRDQKSICKVVKNEYSGQLITINAGLTSFTCTENHLIPIMRSGVQILIEAKYIVVSDEIFVMNDI